MAIWCCREDAYARLVLLYWENPAAVSWVREGNAAAAAQGPRTSSSKDSVEKQTRRILKFIVQAR